jgi:mannosyltransferase OCH1-like enzyme
MTKIKIYHNNWNDLVTIKNNIIKRESSTYDEGQCIFIDNLLSIKWNKWNIELYYQNEINNYYLIENNILLNTMNLLKKSADKELFSGEERSKENISNNILDYKFYVYNIEIILNNNIVYCIIDNKLNKIYNRINLNYIGLFKVVDSNIILINDEEYIYCNFKYYKKNDLIKEYQIINIENELYFLKDNLCIKNYDLINRYEFITYKDILKFNNKIFKTINNYNYFIINETYLSKNENSNNFLKNIYLKNNKYLDKKIIDHYKNIDINIIIIDDIKNKNDNIIYYDLDFIYNEENELLKDIVIEDIEIDFKGNSENNYNLSESLLTKEEYEKFINNLNKKYITKEILINKWTKLNGNNIQYKKYNENNNILNSNRIPKILHFIWIGNNIIPTIYIKYIESWIDHHPDYKYCIWNDDNIPKLINQNLYDSTNVYAMKADILRYEILYFFGGIYVDCDFLCLRNIDELIDGIDGFSGWESEKYIAIGLMGFKRYDNFLQQIIVNLPYSYINNITIPQKTGPIYFTNQWHKNIIDNSSLLPEGEYREKLSLLPKGEYREELSLLPEGK